MIFVSFIFASFAFIKGSLFASAEYENCTAIFIPYDNIYSPQSLVPFKHEEMAAFAMLLAKRSYYWGSQRNGNRIIIWGNRLLVNNTRYNIDLKEDNDHICDNKYATSESPVKRQNSNEVIGYVYRNFLLYDKYDELDESGYFDMARRSVSIDDHQLKRSKYLAACLSGSDTTYANFKCYGLQESDARLAYVKFDFYLYSTDNKTLRARRSVTFWNHWTRNFFVNKNYLNAEDGHSWCYKQRTGPGNDKKINGRLFHVSDDFYLANKAKRGKQLENLLKEENNNYNRLDSCT